MPRSRPPPPGRPASRHRPRTGGAMTARRTRWLTVITLTMSACIVVPTPAGADTADRGGSRGGGGFSAGAPGAGDDYFPFAGNGGFDVKHDDLERQARRPGAEVPAADRLS